MFTNVVLLNELKGCSNKNDEGKVYKFKGIMPKCPDKQAQEETHTRRRNGILNTFLLILFTFFITKKTAENVES